MEPENNSIKPLDAIADKFRGKIIESKSLPDNDHDFAARLHASLAVWKAEKNRGVWLTIPVERSSFISIAAEAGFVCHHAKAKHIVMTHWIPENEPNKLPRYAFHNIGVGGLVINEKKEILVVREKYGGAQAPWKLPGGSADPGEELGETAVREVLEETNIKTEFVSILGFRHHHGATHGMSDFYFIARLKPLSEEITMDSGELLDARWMPIEEYINDPQVTDLNRWVGQLALKHEESDFQNTEFIPKALPTWNKKGTNLFYCLQETEQSKL